MKIGHLSIYVGHLLFLSAVPYNLYVTNIKLSLNLFLSVLFFFAWSCFLGVFRLWIEI